MFIMDARKVNSFMCALFVIKNCLYRTSEKNLICPLIYNIKIYWMPNAPLRLIQIFAIANNA